MKNKTYEVEVWEEVGGYLLVEADSPAEAKRVANAYLEEYGMLDPDEVEPNAFPTVESLQTTHRDTQVLNKPKLTKKLK